MFKAVSQAVYRGEELKHIEVRKKIVQFIVQERWAKLKESIEVQHISGNQLLAKQWKVNPVRAYWSYMYLRTDLSYANDNDLKKNYGMLHILDLS